MLGRIVLLTIVFCLIMGTVMGGAMLLRPDLVQLASHQSTSGTERARIDRISKLPISEEKKEILKTGNIFLGAGKHMVKLAIGEPRFATERIAENGKELIVLGYHFDADGRPTVLEFEHNILINAYRTSYVDIQKQYGLLVVE